MPLSSSIAEAIESNPKVRAGLEKIAKETGLSFETVVERFALEAEKRAGKQKALPTPQIPEGPVGEVPAALPPAPEAGAAGAPPPAPTPKRYPGTESLGAEYEAATGASGMPEGTSLKDLVSQNKGKLAAGGAAAGAAGLMEGDKSLQLPEETIQQMTQTALKKQAEEIPAATAPTEEAPKKSVTPPPPGKVASEAAAPKAAAAAPKEDPVRSIINRYEQSIKTGQEEVRGTMGKRLDELKDLEAEYRQEAKEAKSDAERRELAETLGHAFAQFGAGLQGLKTGVDMTSGLKFNKTDWNKRYELALDELKANLTDLREKRQAVSSEAKEQMRDIEKVGERGMGLEVRAQELKEAEASKAAAEASRRKWEETQKQMDRDTRVEIANIRTTAAQSAAAQKLDTKRKEELDAALNNLLPAYVDYQTGDKDERRLAVKEYAKHKQTINTLLNDGGKTVSELEQRLGDVPLIRGKESFLMEQVPTEAAALRKKAEGAPGARPAAAAVSAPAAGQAPVAGGMIQVKDTTPGSPTFGQVKSVPNSPKVQQLVQAGKIQVVK